MSRLTLQGKHISLKIVENPLTGDWSLSVFLRILRINLSKWIINQEYGCFCPFKQKYDILVICYLDGFTVSSPACLPLKIMRNTKQGETARKNKKKKMSGNTLHFKNKKFSIIHMNTHHIPKKDQITLIYTKKKKNRISESILFYSINFNTLT